MPRKGGSFLFWRLLATASLGAMLAVAGYIAGRMSPRQSERALELQIKSVPEELSESKRLNPWPIEQPGPSRLYKTQARRD